MIIQVIVRPNSQQNEVVFVRDGLYRASVKAAARQNKANEAVIKILATYFKVPKSLVKIIRGHTAKSKTIELAIDQSLFRR